MTVDRYRSARIACAAALLAAFAQPASALDLETALAEAAAGHPALAAGALRADAAEARTGPAGVWPSPMLMLGALNVPESGLIDQEPMTMRMIGVSQRIPLSGRTGLARHAARADAAAAHEDTRALAYRIYGEVWRAYGAAYHAAARERSTADHLSIMERMIASARARYESGAGRLDEVLRAEAARARALVDLASHRAEARRARAALDALRGRPAAQAYPESLLAPPDVVIPDTPEPWLTAAAVGHPALDAVDARARAERLSARAARRSVWPDVEVGFDWGFRETLVTVGPAPHAPDNPPDAVVTTPQEDMWSLRVGVELPIFARGDQFAEGRARDAMADAAEAERRALALALEAEIAAAHAGAIEASRTESLLADTVVVTYHRALDASWSAYTAGTSDLWRTLEAAHELYDQEIALTRAREMRMAAEARFIELTGRGDLLGVALPVPPGGGS